MIKLGLLTMLLTISLVNKANALDIPSYIEDPQDIGENIKIILEKNTPVTDNPESSEEWELKTRELLRQYAAQLYADALSVRANMVGSSTPSYSSSDGSTIPGAGKVVGAVKSIFGKLAGNSESNTEVLQNEVKDYIKNISLRLMQISNLEASIGNLQGLMTINAVNVSLANKNQDEEDGGE